MIGEADLPVAVFLGILQNMGGGLLRVPGAGRQFRMDMIIVIDGESHRGTS
jgi:hypothetical protein